MDELATRIPGFAKRPIQNPPPKDQPPPDPLDELLRKAMQRIMVVGFGSYLTTDYAPLSDRYHYLKNGRSLFGDTLAQLKDDCMEILAMPDSRVRIMAMNRANNPSGNSVSMQLAAREAAQVQANRAAEMAQNMSAIGRPRVSPAELVQQFAARGVVIQAKGGDLHVTPADALTDADRAVLAENKASILAALNRPAAII